MSETQEAAAQIQTESSENKLIEEIPLPKENEKPEEKAPETPVTEPMTNGSTTPESPKEVVQNGDLSPTEQISEDSNIEIVPKPEAITADLQPNDLPLNGLQIDDIAQDKLPPPAEPTPVPVVTPESNGAEISPELSPVSPVLAEPVPVENISAIIPVTEEFKTDVSPEIDVSPVAEVPAEPPALISEVCDNIEAQTPEAVPPPLPSNPPPSSFTAFAESTMAVNLSDVQNLPVDSVAIKKVTNALSADSLAQNVSELDAPFAPNQQIISNIEIQKNVNVPSENLLTHNDNNPEDPNFQQNVKPTSESTESAIPNVQDGVAVVSPVNNLHIPQPFNTQVISEAETVNDTLEIHNSPTINEQTNEILFENVIKVSDTPNKVEEEILEKVTVPEVNTKTELENDIVSEIISDIVSDVLESNVTAIIKNDSITGDLLLENLNITEHTSINNESNMEISEELVSDICKDVSNPVGNEVPQDTVNLIEQNSCLPDIVSSDKLEIIKEAVLSTDKKSSFNLDDPKSQENNTLSTKQEDLQAPDEILSLNKGNLISSDLAILSNSVLNENDVVPSSNILSPDAKEFVPKFNNLPIHSDEVLPLPELALKDKDEFLTENDVISHENLSKITTNAKISLDQPPLVDLTPLGNGILSEDKNGLSIEQKNNAINAAENKQIENLEDIVGSTDKLSNVPGVLLDFSKETTGREDADPVVANHQSPLVCGQPIPLLPSLQDEQADLSDKIASANELIVEATPVVPVTTENGAAE